MSKRGQVAVFFIIGIVVISLLILMYFYRGEIIRISKGAIDTKSYLQDQSQEINNNIQKCIKDETKESVNKFLENGGQFIEPVNYISYHGKKYKVLCQKLTGTDKCLSSPLFLDKVQKEFNEYTKTKIDSCIDLSDYKNSGYELVEGESSTMDLEIGTKEININYEYDVKLIRDEVTLELKRNTVKLDIPLGDLIKEVNEVLNQRAVIGRSDPLSFGLISLNKYFVILHKSYPNELYDVSLTKYPQYHLYFGVQGNGRYA